MNGLEDWRSVECKLTPTLTFDLLISKKMGDPIRQNRCFSQSDLPNENALRGCLSACASAAVDAPSLLITQPGVTAALIKQMCSE